MNRNATILTRPVNRRLLRQVFKLAMLVFAGLFIYQASQAQNITRPNISGPSGLQVNSYTGSLFYQRSDLVIPGLGMPLDISFSYNSSDRSKDYGYGFGWTFTYNRFYSRDSLGLIFHNPDGRRDRYTPANNVYTSPIGIFDVLTEYVAGKFRLQLKDKTEYFFDDSTHKKVTRIKERNGNEITLTYTSGQLSAITDASNRQVMLTWSAGHLSEIKSEAGSPARSISYQYNSSGCLSSVKNAAGHTMQYMYGPGKAMTALIDWNGNAVNILYNGNRAVTKLISCQSEKTISYNTSQRKTYLVEKNGTKNLVTIYAFDETGRLVNKEGNCCGFKNSYGYDADNNINQVTDANGSITLYTYDKKGNILAETDPAGKIIRYTYEAVFNKVTSITDKNGAKTTLVYDNRGNLITVTDALNQAIRYTYDAKGNRLSFKDAKNNTTNYVPNANGYIISITDPAGGLTQFTYDGWGNILTQKDANNHTTSMTYDGLSRLLSVTNAAAGITQYTYDGNGNRLSVKDPNNNITFYSYDAHDNPIQITDALGYSTRMTYDAMDKPLTVTDANGKTSSYEYDNLNRLITETNPAGEAKRYAYDGNGNRVMVSYPNGNTLNIQYDALNRVTAMTDQLGSISSYTYDGNGNRLSETDGKGNTRTFRYDLLSRLITATDGAGSVYKYEYDANDNLLKETDRNNNSTVYLYDALDRRLSMTDALGFVTINTYDATGNMLSVKDAKNNTTRYSYDALDRNTEELFADNTKKMYGYDPAGNLISRRDNSGLLTSYEYDKLNRPVLRIYPTTKDSLRYDATGHLLYAKNKDAVVQFTYDAADRVASETLNGKTTAYTYNVAARIKKITYPGGRIIERVLDGRNQLASIKENGSLNIASFVYDAAGQNTGRSYANGTSANAVYNGNKQVTDLSYSPSRFIDLGYSYDKEDNPVSSQFRHRNANSEQYGYDKLNQLTNYKKGGNTQSTFNYDGVGNRASAQVNGVSISYAVNSMNAYSSITGASNLNPTYDGNGNVTADGDHIYTYDPENRIVTVDNGTTARYRYDALGRRIQKLALNDTINYFFDGLQVIEERDNHDVVKASYIWGTWLDDIVSMQRNGQAYYFHSNTLGSVMGITNSTGAVVERYEYDAFGKATIFNTSYSILQTSSIGNTYSYTGRQFEPETGLYYYRARYYDAEQGRFLQRDPLGYVDGMGLYAYVGNRPINLKDPIGLAAVDFCEDEFDYTRLIPIYGSSLDAIDAFNRGDYVWAAVHTGLAISDVFLLKAALTAAGKIAFRVGGAVLVKKAENTVIIKAVAAGDDFFAGTKYSKKVVAQMRQNDFHAFPESVKVFQADGVVTTIVGKDGLERQMLRIPGGYKGKDGVFEFIKEADGTINHRFFKVN